MNNFKKKKIRIALLCMGGLGMMRYGLAYSAGLCETDKVKLLILVQESDALAAQKLIDAVLQSSKVNIEIIPEKSHYQIVKKVLAALFSFHPDLIHDTTGVAWKYGPVVWPLLRLRYPLFITLHDPMPHSGMGNRIWTRFKRKLCMMLPNSVVVHGYSNYELAKKMGITTRRLIISKHGQLDIFSRLKAKKQNSAWLSDEKMILVFGVLRPNKGIEMLPEIAKIVYERRKDVCFLVAGPAPDRKQSSNRWTERLNSLLSDMREKPYFSIHDRFIPDEEVGLLFSQATVVLLSYRDATQSGILMTAMAFGKPIVATDVGGISDVIQDGKTGKLVDLSTNSIADAILELLENPRAALEIGLNAQRFATKEFCWRRIAEDMIIEYSNSLMV